MEGQPELRRPVPARLGAVVALALSCGGGTRLPPAGPHPPNLQDFVEVPFPPPPAQLEEIPERLEDSSCVWTGGYYRWEKRRFSWQPGRWVVAPPDCYYAGAVIAWSKAGEPRLYYTPPRWYPDDALSRTATACPAPRPCQH